MLPPPTSNPCEEMLINKRTSKSENVLAPAALETTHYLHARVLDDRAREVDKPFLLNMGFDQTRNAFVNTEQISLTATESHVVQSLMVSNGDNDIANIDLAYPPVLTKGDTISFDIAAIVIEIPHGMHLEMPGLHVIEEEPSLYD